jgi:hypothetical protein
VNLLDRITSYDFACEGGPLTLCTDWLALRAQIESLYVVLDAGSIGIPHAILHTAGHGGWRTYVFTNAAEAEAARVAFQGDHRIPRDRFSVARLIDVLPLVAHAVRVPT